MSVGRDGVIFSAQEIAVKEAGAHSSKRARSPANSGSGLLPNGEDTKGGRRIFRATPHELTPMQAGKDGETFSVLVGTQMVIGARSRKRARSCESLA
jgi:hypothetical protein